jgi:hypothetical protein
MAVCAESQEGHDKEFTNFEKAISQTFLPALFGKDYDDDDDDDGDPCHSLACLSVKHVPV